METTIYFEFGDIQPFQGYSVFVSGTATINAEYEEPDREVGYRGGWVYRVESISPNREDITLPEIKIEEGHPLWNGLVLILEGPGYYDLICEELRDSVAVDPDYGRD
jgi:hypothetical protein